VVLVVMNPEFPLDSVGDADACPDIAPKAICLRPVPKQIRDKAFLSMRQLSRMPRRCMRSQRLHARIMRLVHPLADSRRCNVQGVGDVMLSPTSLLQA